METFVYACIVFVVSNLNFHFPAASLENEEFRTIKESHSSSVWCHPAEGSLLCTFTDLCYSSLENQFIFTLTERSVIHGLDSRKDFQSIQLSSVRNHNLFHLNTAIVSPLNPVFKKPTLQHGPVFLLWRFKWDNIMHVIHDDLLPLYYTYLEVCVLSVDTCLSKYRLAFIDEGGRSPFENLYRLFSNEDPLFLRRQDKNSLICFENVHAGLLSTTLWFQYGFGVPQGPLKNSNVHGFMLQEFKNFIISKLNIPHKLVKKDVIVLFSRKLSRKILNEDQLISTVQSSFKKHFSSKEAEVIVVDLATHNISSIIEVLLTTHIVVGMHGSALILCLFLEPGSVVVELFPFGISANHVSHIKALSELSGVGFVYRSWENRVEANSITYPEASPLHGGISHLSEKDQDEIKSTRTVPAVHCCHNPLYLYRMFQDTVVGEDFADIFVDALNELSEFSKQQFEESCFHNLWSKWYFPAPVSNIQCFNHDGYVKINWSEPINIRKPDFYTVALVIGETQPRSVRTSESEIDLPLPVGNKAVLIDIWVKVVSTLAESRDEYHRCSVK